MTLIVYLCHQVQHTAGVSLTVDDLTFRRHISMPILSPDGLSFSSSMHI